MCLIYIYEILYKYVISSSRHILDLKYFVKTMWWYVQCLKL